MFWSDTSPGSSEDRPAEGRPGLEAESASTEPAGAAGAESASDATGDGGPVGEAGGGGSPVGRGAGAGAPIGEGSAAGAPVGEGSAAGAPVGEGSGAGAPIGEGSAVGTPIGGGSAAGAPIGEGSAAGAPVGETGGEVRGGGTPADEEPQADPAAEEGAPAGQVPGGGPAPALSFAAEDLDVAPAGEDSAAGVGSDGEGEHLPVVVSETDSLPLASEEPADADEAHPDEPDLIEDEVDQIAADEGFLSAMAAEFDAIQAALVRLDDGTFDDCQVCGGHIGQDRLMADPLLTRCPAHS